MRNSETEWVGSLRSTKLASSEFTTFTLGQKMSVFTYELPHDYPNVLTGVYDKETGDSPHELLAFGYTPDWTPPVVRFDVPLSRIDPIPSSNLPLPLIRNDLGISIGEIARDSLRLIPVDIIASQGQLADGYSLLFPTSEAEIWDLKRSSWRGLDTEEWPDDKPMYMADMVLKQDLNLPVPIAFNSHWKRMVVFQEPIAELIRRSGSWVRVFEPQHYRNE